MRFAKSCPQCAASLPADAPEGALCPACADAVRKSGGVESMPIDLVLASDELTAIGDFVILGKLGQGGMGAVYRARQVSLDRIVALKVLPVQFGSDPETVGRFQREAKVASGFRHPNLVSVFSYGIVGGRHLIAMELVEGENLQELLRQRRVDMAEALRITADVARGLECGWETALVVHRDIKPSNIYISHDGHVKVGDLGLAKSLLSEHTNLTMTGMMMGTPRYMSPEQCDGQKLIDFRADVYSLGCMLFEMLAGKAPYDGIGALSIMNKHINSPPPVLLKELPSCPLPVARLVGRMLKKVPRERHASYQELIAEIEEVRQTLKSEAPITPPRRPTPPAAVTPAPFIRKKKPEGRLWLIGALVFLALTLLFIFLPHPTQKRVKRSATPIASTPITPPPIAVAATPRATPIVAPAREDTRSTSDKSFGPWQPFLTGEEWQQTSLGKRELVDGRLHLRGPSISKPQPYVDGAIRARIRFQEGSRYVALTARKTPDNTYYKAELNLDGTAVQLSYFRDSVKNETLGVFTLPAPLQPGNTLLLELRLQGDRLTTLVNGAVVIDVRDSRCPGPGQWGIVAADGWFESVEVQTPAERGPGVPPVKKVGTTAGTAVSLSTATKDAPFVNTLGMKFVPVPIVGGPTAGKIVLFSIWDTRVQDYEVFAKETGRDFPSAKFEQGPTHPVSNMSWDDAKAFCAWLTEHESRAGGAAALPAGWAYRLPSDHEWSCAVGIGEREDAKLAPAEKNRKIDDVFPWGTAWPPSADAANLAVAEDGYANTSPVGSFAANRFGLYDLGGNVWQWCEDWYDTTEQERMLRGAAWSGLERRELVSSVRFHRAPDARLRYFGFRCVLAKSP